MLPSWHKEVHFPHVTLAPGQEPAARQLALQGSLNPPDLTEGSIVLELLN